MNHLKKTTDSDDNILSQIVVICGLVISVLLISKNWQKSTKSARPPSKPDTSTNPVDKSLAVIEKDKQESPTSKENRATLTKFIENNEKLINVLGVFTAVTVFVGELRIQAFGYALSFMFMTLTVILWFELWEKFPSGSGEWKLFWFENILFLTVLALLAYWLIDFRDIWGDFLFLLIFLVLSGSFSVTMKRFGVFNRLFHAQPGERKSLRYFLGIVIISSMILASMAIAQGITPAINEFLDGVNQSIINAPP